MVETATRKIIAVMYIVFDFRLNFPSFFSASPVSNGITGKDNITDAINRKIFSESIEFVYMSVSPPVPIPKR